ncbi:pentapeptide repeat-containing protein [Streptomyces osmaniensis]|uniref:Pentapeptide repeat-containing protein n=1 Tax=Streptomyces osmaniensis TaxID=593134 RepID=A0ABP6W206_9ACTN|nr:pentapeptide repeat-containing protein [Streptomyces sp. JCM17656]
MGRLPGLAALAALLFTWMQVRQANDELRISQEGQITNRLNAAISNLGSQSLDIRMGGIYALRRIMEGSPHDHPAVVSVLAAYAKQHAGSSAKSLQKEAEDEQALKVDVHAAIGVLAKRRLDRDSGEADQLWLSNTDLRLLAFYETPISLPGVRMDGADLRSTSFRGADLRGADLTRTNLTDADFRGANLARVQLDGAQMTGAKGLPEES